jgi:hypothetical protein
MKFFRRVKPTKASPYFNHEAYPDPTAYFGMKDVIKEEEEVEKQVSDIVHIVKLICSATGFEVVGRIQFKHKKSGRVFK